MIPLLIIDIFKKNRDVIWSADNYVEGYTKTGNTKVQ